MFNDIEHTTYKQIIFIGLSIIGGLIVFAGGGMILASAFWSAEDIIAATSYIIDTPERLNYMRYLQFLTMFGTFFFPAVALSLVTKKPNFSFLYLNRGLDIKKVVMIVTMMVISIPIINYLMIRNQGFNLPQWMIEKETQLTGISEQFLMVTSFEGLLINLLIMAVLPALSEEFIFRGILMKWFNKSMGIHLSIFLSALIFSAIHMQFLGFLPRFFLGVVLGYVFYWSGSLWASIFLHFLNNGMAVVTYFLVARGTINVDPETFGTIESVPLIMVNTLVFGAVMYWFYRNRVQFQL